MSKEKRPFLDIADLLILLGVVLAGVGFYRLDWRLALIFLGLVCMALGAVRLRHIERGERQ